MVKTTGIYMGFKCAFISEDKRFHILRDRNKLYTLRENGYYPIEVLFPSPRKPGDLRRTVAKVGSFFLQNDVLITQTYPLDMGGSCSPVRLYQDVLLVFDSNNELKLVRVIIPDEIAECDKITYLLSSESPYSVPGVPGISNHIPGFNPDTFKNLTLSSSGISATNPVPAELDLLSSPYDLAFLSPKGVMSICCPISELEQGDTQAPTQNSPHYKFTTSPPKYIVQFHELLGLNRSSSKQYDHLVQTGFWDDYVLFLEDTKKLSFARVEDVLENCNTWEATVLDNSLEVSTMRTDTILLDKTHRVYYKTKKSQLACYDLDNNQSTLLGDLGKPIASTGVYTGYDVIVRNNFGLFALVKGGFLIRIMDESTHVFVVFPSLFDPGRLQKAMFGCGIFNGPGFERYGLYMDKMVQGAGDFILKDYASFVRLEADLFLCYNMRLAEWQLIRIYVP